MKKNYYFYIIPSFRRLGILLLLLSIGYLFSSENSSSQYSIQFLNSITNQSVPKVAIYTRDSLLISDESGKINLDGNNFESSPLRFEKLNFISKTIYELPENDIIYLDPVIYPVKEVIVEKEAPLLILNSPIAPYILSPENIQNYSSTQALLQRLPGITIRSYGGRAGISTISVHGGQSHRFVVMFDGIPINNEQNGGADISTIPHLLLSQVEYLPQGHSSRFGPSAMTGILSVSPRTSKSKISFTAGNFNQFSGGLLSNNKFGNSTLTFGLGNYQFDADYTYIETGDYSDVSYQIGKSFPGLKNKLIQSYIYTAIDSKVNATTDFLTSFFRVENSRTLATNVYASPINMQDMEDELSTFSIVLSKPWAKMHYMGKSNTIAYLQDQHALFTHTLNASFLMPNWTIKLNHNRIINKSTRTIDTTKSVNSVILEYKESYWGYDILLSTRTEWEKSHASVGSFDAIFTRINPWKQWVNSFTISRNYKKPNFNDLFWEPFGNPNLQTEFSTNMYFQHSSFNSLGQLLAGMHYIHFEDLINWRPMAGTNAYWIPENISFARSYGFNLTGKSIPLKGFSIEGNYSLTKTENHNMSLDNIHQGKTILYTPQNSGSFSILGSNNNVKFGYSLQYTGARLYRYSSPNDNELPGYIQSNVSINKILQENNSLVLEGAIIIENIFNKQYQTIYGFPNPGRTISLTITINERQFDEN